MNNPYLEDFKTKAENGRKRIDIERSILFGEAHDVREELVTQYAWAVPNEAAISKIVGLGPVVEIGAGTGYWASLIAQAGGDILAFDLHPPETSPNAYRHRREYYPVQPGGSEKAQEHADRVLFLCWPPWDDPMGFCTLTAYRKAGGQRVVYVGEDMHGCTGDDDFHRLLRKGYEEVEYCGIPNWYGIHDALSVWLRK